MRKSKFALLVVWVVLQLSACQPFPPSPKDSGEAVAGAELYRRLACHGCHRRNGVGGILAPDLDRLATRMTKTDIERQLVAPRPQQTTGRMPTFAFVRPEELQELINFLHHDAD